MALVFLILYSLHLGEIASDKLLLDLAGSSLASDSLDNFISSLFDGLLGEIYSSLLRAWDGKIELSGWSMGGYQTMCVAGLAAKAGIPLSFVRSVIPGFCNLSGHAVGGRFNNVFGIGYDEAMRYLDAAALAEYIDSYVEIPRCGLGDYTCPPAGIIAAYNAMKCKKKIRIYQNATHGYVPADTDIFTSEEGAKPVG